jgi:hypothetical protein
MVCEISFIYICKKPNPNMDKRQIIIFAVVAVYAGIRLYQKYYKKSPASQPEKKKEDFSSSSDDYEPYSKK